MSAFSLPAAPLSSDGRPSGPHGTSPPPQHASAGENDADAHRPLEYRFVEGLDRSYSRSVRAHVLSRHLSERRLRAEQRRRNKHKTGGEEAGAPSSANAPDAIAGHEVGYVRPPRPEPTSWLGQGRVDPFRTSAYATINPTEDFLVDFYCGDILAPYGVRRDDRVLHPPRDMCMQLIASDTLCMHVLFTYTAQLLSERGGPAPFATLALKHRVAAIQLLKERVHAPAASADDATLMAVLGLVATVMESRPYGTSAAQEQETALHVQGVRAMIAARGGLAPHLYPPTIYWLIHWVDMCYNGDAFPSTAPLSEHAFASPSRLREPASVPGAWLLLDRTMDPLRCNAEEFVGAYGNFYREARARSHAHRRVTPASPSGETPVCVWEPMRAGSHLHDVLSSSTPHVLRPVIPTLGLNIMLWHYRPSNATGRLDHAARALFPVILQRLALAKSLVSLTWALLTDPASRRLHHPPSAWLLCRLLRVESRLSGPLRRQLQTALLQFLMRDDDQALARSWLTPDQVRSAVMADLGFEDSALPTHRDGRGTTGPAPASIGQHRPSRG